MTAGDTRYNACDGTSGLNYTEVPIEHEVKWENPTEGCWADPRLCDRLA